MGFLTATIDINTHDWLYLWSPFILLWFQTQRKMASLTGAWSDQPEKPWKNPSELWWKMVDIEVLWLKRGLSGCDRWWLLSPASGVEGHRGKQHLGCWATHHSGALICSCCHVFSGPGSCLLVKTTRQWNPGIKFHSFIPALMGVFSHLKPEVMVGRPCLFTRFQEHSALEK